ncbi:hypothetical protein Pan44_40760 [Caulifigura coniformis]|uniref:Uncharacterized protein n=1 Tax=Caulifigura coniformis TaxID=2527983 RepID=A0A517SIV6_9PLAN|nr:hypothetical protein [Caulifigura coniformis]QDT56026.1 hypothetical protein Pan44_40760 [Caulifigura coniformis]
MEYRILDIEIVAGSLVVILEECQLDTSQRSSWSRVVVRCGEDPSWFDLDDSSRRAFVLRNEQTIHWPSSGRSVNVDELLQGRNPSFRCRWRNDRARSDIDREALIGCWEDPQGWVRILLEADGSARVRHVSKGSAFDLPGDHRWEWLGQNAFTLTSSNPNPNVAIGERYVACRFDGNVLILESYRELPFPCTGIVTTRTWRIWTRSRRPKGWRM